MITQVKNVIIVGGTSAVSQAVETAITAAGIKVQYRIAGADRTATAAQIAAWALNGLPVTPTYQALAAIPGWVSNSATVWLARGDNFADALAAGPVAGALGESIVLTASPTTVGPGIATYFAGQAGAITGDGAEMILSFPQAPIQSTWRWPCMTRTRSA